MDRFDLNWPNADAEFFTDGWRCRIVWRQKGKRNGGGMGGTIDNNTQCVRRVAESLEGAPYLLSALKARGHERLAGQIESVVQVVSEEQPQQASPAPARKPVRAERRDAVSVQPRIAKVADRQRRSVVAQSTPKSVPKLERPMPANRAAPKQAERAQNAAGSPVVAWLQALAGSEAFEAASNRRAKAWIDLGSIEGTMDKPDEALFLKCPAAKGKQEWVLKRTWPGEPKRKAEYVAAEHFRGVASYLVGAGACAADIERLFKATSDVKHEALAEAATAWRASASDKGRAH